MNEPISNALEKEARDAWRKSEGEKAWLLGTFMAAFDKHVFCYYRSPYHIDDTSNVFFWQKSH